MLAVKEHLQGALHLVKRPLPLMERTQKGQQHIGIMFDLIQVKMILVIIVSAFVAVQIVGKLRL